MIDLVKYLLFLAFLIPSFSFGAFVPPQIPARLVGTTWNYFPQTNANPLFELIDTASSTQITADLASDPVGFYNQFRGYIYSADSPHYATSTPTNNCSSFTQSSPRNTSDASIATSSIASCHASFPADEFVYVNIYVNKSTDPINLSLLYGYMKFRYNGTNWVDALGAGASGSWDFTSTSTLPVDFTDFAQGLKDAIANNTTQPDCPTLTSILEIGNKTFWQDCVLPTIFNWLFVPSDDAIDYMVGQMTSSTQFGSSFVYILLAPVVSSVAVTACDLDNVSACFVGSPLTLPVLDVTGSSTPTVIDVNIPFDTSGFDDFMATVVATLVLLGVGHVTLFKFL